MIPDITTLAGYASWSAVALAIIATVVWRLRRSDTSDDIKQAKRIEYANRYRSTYNAWNIAVRNGDTALAMRLKTKLDSMRSMGWHLLNIIILFLAITLLTSGCKTAKTKIKPIIIPVGIHIHNPIPGSTVPELPEGETMWWLCTPTGLSLLLPEDSAILRID